MDLAFCLRIPLEAMRSSTDLILVEIFFAIVDSHLGICLVNSTSGILINVVSSRHKTWADLGSKSKNDNSPMYSFCSI